MLNTSNENTNTSSITTGFTAKPGTNETLAKALSEIRKEQAKIRSVSKDFKYVYKNFIQPNATILRKKANEILAQMNESGEGIVVKQKRKYTRKTAVAQKQVVEKAMKKFIKNNPTLDVSVIKDLQKLANRKPKTSRKKHEQELAQAH